MFLIKEWYSGSHCNNVAWFVFISLFYYDALSLPDVRVRSDERNERKGEREIKMLGPCQQCLVHVSRHGIHVPRRKMEIYRIKFHSEVLII